ncbi:fimbria/pilus chaperone family protein [Pseudomonas sp. NPDC007930]|uniref:fimbria/pilus chaperone family protein n=1 Tax=Pseudomonas sp. NPDC007930 TaxID=3364417 RepID=UPI0036E09885
MPSRLFALMALATACLFTPLPSAHAAGMQPETTVVLVKVAEGEGSIAVRNTDTHPALLHAALQNLPEDPAELLLVTPPLARVEPGKLQTVRFIVQPGEPITTQRMMRATFEGIAPQRPGDQARVAVTVQHNLPVIIHPEGLAPKRDPWALLQWRIVGGQLSAHNPSPYVVRLVSELTLLPGGQGVSLPTTYLLPGQARSVALPAGGTVSAVRFYPASLYGYAVAPFEAPVQQP